MAELYCIVLKAVCYLGFPGRDSRSPLPAALWPLTGGCREESVDMEAVSQSQLLPLALEFGLSS